MQQPEPVTFGGSDLDRAAQLRTDPGSLARIRSEGEVIPFWRGKPFVIGDPEHGSTELVRLTGDHPVLRTPGPEFFLGLLDGTGIFGKDISDWDPPEPVDEAQITAFLDPSVQRHPAYPEAAFRELRGIMTTLSHRDAELAATGRALINWHRSHGFCAKCGAASDMVQAGWQRTCPACGTHHFPRTDPVVIMLITSGEKVLLGRSPGWPEGMYSLLAGFIEPGETIEAAVRREVFEESGIRVGDVDYLACQPWPFPASLMMGCRGEALNEDIVIDPNEIEAARWVTRSELLEVFAGTHPDIRPARRGAIAHYILERWLADKLG